MTESVMNKQSVLQTARILRCYSAIISMILPGTSFLAWDAVLSMAVKGRDSNIALFLLGIIGPAVGWQRGGCQSEPKVEAKHGCDSTSVGRSSSGARDGG
ncbi:hypothetical protein DL98DRAFT_255736 [Cadophora sp. DSE1049]|nr:hypothetical protein DL98DRAFT_255736 [Cadophora sp. DSE1049]